MIAPRRLLLAAGLCVAVPAVAAAQGTLSTQGLGFPPGQLSTMSRSMGGASGEVDPYSPLNPAALGLLTSAIVMMQAEPEYRTVQIGARSHRTSIARFPLFQGALPLGSRWAIAVSASTLLDRTWETTTRDSQFIPDTIPSTVIERSDGSISDLRIALSFAPLRWLRVGVGAHALSGRDQLRTIRAFDDTIRFAADTVGSTLSFGGNAVSVGALAIFPRVAALGVSYRFGGGISSESNGRTLGTGTVPDHMGVSLLYLGVRGATFAARAAKDRWSSLQGMRTGLNIHEGWDMGVGVDANGPNLGSNTISLRLGGRWRTLPFSADTSAVTESTLSGGFALPMARSRVELNLGALRATRRWSGGASETGWTISTGFSVRP